MEDLTISLENIDNIKIFHIAGILDAKTHMDFQNFLSENLTEGTRYIIFEMENLVYINSVAFGTLVSNIKKIQSRKGKVCFLTISDEMKHVFDLTGFKTIFDFFTVKEDALNFFKNNINE